MHLSFLIFIVFSHAVDLSLYSEPNDNGFIYAREQREFIIDIDAFGGKKIRRNKKRDSSKQEKKIKKKKHLMLLCMWLMATHNNQQSTEIERKKEKKKLFLLTYPTSTYFGSFFFSLLIFNIDVATLVCFCQWFDSTLEFRFVFSLTCHIIDYLCLETDDFSVLLFFLIFLFLTLITSHITCHHTK